MNRTLRVALAQLNLTVGNISNNQQLITEAIAHARDNLAAELVVFPELAISGYPPEDLLLRNDYLAQCHTAMMQIVNQCTGIAVLLGYPQQLDERCYNAAVLIQEQRIQASYAKQRLPNYGVFDEKRYFSAGDKHCVVEINGIAVGILICEDLWYPQPIEDAVSHGAEIIVSMHASPFHKHKAALRMQTIQQRAREQQTPIVYVHNVGGQDELIFDGGSMVLDKQGETCHLAPPFQSTIDCVNIDLTQGTVDGNIHPLIERYDLLYQALCAGTHDYVQKNGFEGVLIGLSGGIDSALALTIAVDALGADNVEAVMMPSRYTSDMSLEDAETLAKNLSVNYRVISIEASLQTLLDQLSDHLQQTPNEITQQNLQARCRAVLLMALSNQLGKLVLSTSNKSESAVGYSTLYGDMVGAFSILKDIYKTDVFALAKHRNLATEVIPERIISRAPSAELAEAQQDSDSLPPYDVLDPIIERYVERDESIATIVAAGFDNETVQWVVHMIKCNEYKRRQSPPGIRVTPRAFGKDRRYPITSGFEH